MLRSYSTLALPDAHCSASSPPPNMPPSPSTSICPPHPRTFAADWSSLAPLYASAWFWTMNYDTIYAHMDKKDDVNVGIGSTALAFGDGKSALYALSACMTTSLAAAGYCAGACWPFYAVSVGGTAAHLGWQVGSVNLSKPQDCLKVFRSNKHLGLIVLCGILASAVVSSAEQKKGAEEEPEEDRVVAL